MAVSFADGFESGGTSSWSTIVGTPTVQNSVVQEGTWALLTTASEGVSHTIAAGNRVVVVRYWFRTSADPTGARSNTGGFTTSTNVNMQIKLTGVISIYDGATEVDTGPDLAAGSWYRADMMLNTTANPWVISWQVGGVDQGNTNIAHAAADIISFSIGNTAAGVTNTYVDHFSLSLVAGDYPINDQRAFSYGAQGGINSTSSNSISFGTSE